MTIPERARRRRIERVKTGRYTNANIPETMTYAKKRKRKKRKKERKKA